MTHNAKDYRAPAQFSLDDGRSWHDAEISEISTKGAFFSSSLVPNLSARIRVRFDVPSKDKSIELPAAVVTISDSDDPLLNGFAVVFSTGAVSTLEKAPGVPGGKKPQREARVVSSGAVRFDVAGAPVFYTGFIQNISHGGLFVHSYTMPPLGRHVTVKFRVPYSSEDVELPVRVVWHRLEEAGGHPETVGFGAAFDELPTAVEDAINRSIKEGGEESDFFA